MVCKHFTEREIISTPPLFLVNGDAKTCVVLCVSLRHHWIKAKLWVRIVDLGPDIINRHDDYDNDDDDDDDGYVMTR